MIRVTIEHTNDRDADAAEALENVICGVLRQDYDVDVRGLKDPYMGDDTHFDLGHEYDYNSDDLQDPQIVHRRLVEVKRKKKKVK